MREGVKPFKRARLQWAGIGLGILYWFLESLLDSFLFHQGSLLERILTPDPNELWMRLLVISLLIIFGFYAQSLIDKRNLAEEEARKINEDLDLRVIERTAQLETAEGALNVEWDKLRNILESMKDGVYIVNQSYDIEYINPVIEREFGPISGRKCYKYFHERDEVCPWCKNPEVFAGKTVQWEWHSDKNNKTYDLLDTPLHNYDGSISKLEIFRDITERKQAAEALLVSEEKFRALAEQSIVGACLIQDGKFIYVNPRLAEILDFRQEEMLGLPVLDLVAEPDRDMVRENMRKRISGEVSYLRYTFHALKKGGSEVPMEVHGSAMKYLGRPAIMATLLDITERRQAEEEIENSLSLLRATLEATADGILVVNNDGKMLGFNQNFLNMWRIPESIAASRDDDQALAFVLAQLKNPEGFLGKVKELYSQPDAESFDALEFKDGRLFERYSRPQRIGERSVGRVWSFRDVTEQKRAEEKIKHLAYHDSLTGLPNRALFYDRLHQAIISGKRENEPVALMFLDMDRFKEINDTHGHHYGDFLLKQVGSRIREILRQSDTVSRIGGDEFAVILPRPEKIEGAIRTAEKIMEAIRTPFSLEKTTCIVTISIGIAVFPDHGKDIDLLLQRADAAMYAAKQSGRGFVVYGN